MFIKLTLFIAYRATETSHGDPVLVDMSKVVAIYSKALPVVTCKEDLQKPIKEREAETCTYLCFAACDHEGNQLSIEVQETPEQIRKLLPWDYFA